MDVYSGMHKINACHNTLFARHGHFLTNHKDHKVKSKHLNMDMFVELHSMHSAGLALKCILGATDRYLSDHG